MEIDECQDDVGGRLSFVWVPPTGGLPTIDIIAVYGLYNTYTDNWFKPEDPEGSLGPLLKGFSSIARIFAFGSAIYEDILSDKSALEKAATALLEAVAIKINTEKDEKRPLVFLCHDLAGILVKELLWIANHEEKYINIAFATRVLACFGTPDSTSDWDDVLFKLLLTRAKTLDGVHEPAQQTKTRKLMKGGVLSLKAASTRYEMIKNQYKNVSLSEQSPTHGVRIIVSPNTETCYHSFIQTIQDRLCNRDDALLCVINEIKNATAMEKKYHQWATIDCRRILAVLYDQDGRPGEMLMGTSTPFNCALNDKILNRGPGITMIYGSAGSGKSILASQISASKGFDSESSIVLSYYFSAGDYRRSSYRSLLISFILQLLYWRDLPFDSAYVQQLYSSMAKLRPIEITTSDLYRLFCGMLFSISQVNIACIIDALDECDESSCGQLLGDFRRLIPVDSTKRKAFMTCRPTESIEALVRPFIEVNGVDLDKELDGLKEEMLKISSQAYMNGLAKENITPLMITLLSTLNQPADVAMITVDTDYSMIYKRVLEQIDAPSLWLRDVLICLAFAKRPLRISELAGAMWMNNSSLSSGSPPTLQKICISAPKDLQQDLELAFGPLLRVENGIVYLLHNTLRDFIRHQSNFILQNEVPEPYQSNETAGQLYMLHKCLSMLSIPELRKIDEFSTKRRPFDMLCDLPIASAPHSFAFYAGSCLAIHIRDIAKDNDEAKSIIVQNWLSHFFFLDNSDARSWWIQTFISCQVYMDVERDTEEPVAILRLYALLGFEKTVNWLLCQVIDGTSAEFKPGVESALWDALRQGHTGTVEILLQLAVNFKEAIWAPILEKVCQDGNANLVETIILRWSKDVRSQPSKEHIIKCLRVVAEYGHWYIIPRIRQAHRDLMAYMDRNILAELIEIASKNGRDGVVCELLSMHGHSERYSIQTDDLDSGTTNTQQNEDNSSWLSNALVAAARFGSAAIIPLLVEHADLDYRSEWWPNFTSLHEAAIENKTEAMEMLLDYRCDIDCQDEQGATPLMLSCIREHVRAVQVLLTRGANPDYIAKTTKYRPLHLAARQGNEVLVRTLLEAGASENARLDKPTGNTPLHLAVSPYISSETGHVRAVRTLLEFGADVNAINDHGSTPLHMAVDLSQPGEDLIKTLIEFGADIDKLDTSDCSALYYALKKRSSQIARILWDPQGLKDKQVSVLFDAASEGNVSRVKQLLKANCDKAEKDAQGRIAFDVATSFELKDLLRL